MQTDTLELRTEVAAYEVDSLDAYVARLRLVADTAEAGALTRVYGAFAVRFAEHWRQTAPEIAATARQLAEGAHRISASLAPIFAFYGSAHPGQVPMTFQLLARPPHPSPTYGQQLRFVSLVEVGPREDAKERLDVLLHELFHYLLASAGEASLRTLARGFVASTDPDARAAYGLFDEATATCFGQGAVRAALGADITPQLTEKGRFYHEEFIDGAARAWFAGLTSHVKAGGRVTDPDVAARFVDAVRQVYPRGLPPRARWRPLVAIHSRRLVRPFERIAAMAMGSLATSDGWQGGDVAETLAGRAGWPRVLMLDGKDFQSRAWVAHVSERQRARLLQRRGDETLLDVEPGTFEVDRERGETTVIVADTEPRANDAVSALLAQTQRVSGRVAVATRDANPR